MRVNVLPPAQKKKKHYVSFTLSAEQAKKLKETNQRGFRNQVPQHLE